MSSRPMRVAGVMILFVVVVVLLTLQSQRWIEGRGGRSDPAPAAEAALALQEGSAPALPPDEGRALLNEFSRTFEQAAARVNASVVPIFSEATVTVRSPFGSPGDGLSQFFGDQLYQRFFGQAPGQEQRTVHALGSGVIVSPDGYILTNNHVVANAQKLTVVLGNGNHVPARVIGTDPPTDLALIKVDETGLPAAVLGNSDSVRVAQWVIAVGNPFQLLHTTTAGIISAKGRSSVGLADYEDFIQTDAAINPGNSGGALADMDGRVIGINAAISTPSGGSVGLGFAIPINMARSVMEQLEKNGRVVRGYLGVALQTLTPDLAKALGAGTTRGVLVGDVRSGGPADEAGFKRGDIVTHYQGQPVDSVLQLRDRVAGTAPGTGVDFRVLRDGRATALHVTLGEQPRPAAKKAAAQPPTAAPERIGLSVQTLTPELAQELGYTNRQGAVVADVRPGSPAESAGLQRGDLIEDVNRQPVRTARELGDRLEALKSGQSAALLVRRGDNTFFTTLQAP